MGFDEGSTITLISDRNIPISSETDDRLDQRVDVFRIDARDRRWQTTSSAASPSTLQITGQPAPMSSKSFDGSTFLKIGSRRNGTRLTSLAR